jgi:hypothetical protein
VNLFWLPYDDDEAIRDVSRNLPTSADLILLAPSALIEKNKERWNVWLDVNQLMAFVLSREAAETLNGLSQTDPRYLAGWIDGIRKANRLIPILTVGVEAGMEESRLYLYDA